jgi:hypothetical protein
LGTGGGTVVAVTGFAAGGAGGGAAVVVVVGSACRNDALSTPVWTPVLVVGVVPAFATGAVRLGAVAVMRSANATGTVHDVESADSVASARTRSCPAPSWCCCPCNVARCGVASRRSGAITRARQHPRRTAGRNPPALWFGVLRPPPFLCGLHGYCVGIDNDARRGCAPHQTETVAMVASSIFDCDVQATERDIVTTLQERLRSVSVENPVHWRNFVTERICAATSHCPRQSWEIARIL